MIRSLVLIAASVCVATLSAAEPDAKSWTGQKVLARKPGLSLAVEGKADRVPVKHIVYSCVADDGEFIRVNYPGQEGRADKADWIRLSEALEYFTTLTKTDPGNAFAWSRRGVAHRYAGKLDLALKDLQEAVRLAPRDADFVGIRGMMWWANKDLDKAIVDYTEAVRLDPTYAVGFRNRAMALQAKGELDKALLDYAEAARIAPHYAPTFHERAAVWRLKKDDRKALADLKEAIRLDPRYAAAFTDLARVLATSMDDSIRDGKSAVQHAEKAVTLTGGKDASAFDALAVAHAEAGDFAKAIEAETKALNDAAYEKEHGTKAREKLKAFEQKQAWRE